MMSTSRFLVVLCTLLVTGCGGGNADDDTAAADTQEVATARAQALQGYASCWTTASGVDRTLYFEAQTPDGWDGFLQVRFEAVAGTHHNNFFVTVIHHDGSWWRVASPDDVEEAHELQNAYPDGLGYDNRYFGLGYLAEVGASSEDVVREVHEGDLLAIRAVFDLPNRADKSCTAYMIR